MPSTILSDNGASSGTAGIKTTGSNDGQLALQTTTAGGTATTAITIDTSQNVGVGTGSPNGKVDITSTSAGANTNTLVLTNASSNASTATSLIFGVSTGPTTRNATIRGINTGGNAIDLAFLTSNGDVPVERMRVLNTGNILCLAGGSTTATGTGIAFPATQSASTDANTLDDYEEGTWTPSLGGNTTYNTQAGTYTKVGRMVVARGNVNVNTIGTGSTGIVTGLPFTTATIFGVQVGYWGLTANNFVFIGGFSNSSTQIDFYTATAATGTLGNGTAIFGNGTNLHFTITYFI